MRILVSRGLGGAPLTHGKKRFFFLPHRFALSARWPGLGIPPLKVVLFLPGPNFCVIFLKGRKRYECSGRLHEFSPPPFSLYGGWWERGESAPWVRLSHSQSRKWAVSLLFSRSLIQARDTAQGTLLYSCVGRPSPSPSSEKLTRMAPPPYPSFILTVDLRIPRQPQVLTSVFFPPIPRYACSRRNRRFFCARKESL